MRTKQKHRQPLYEMCAHNLLMLLIKKHLKISVTSYSSTKQSRFKTVFQTQSITVNHMILTRFLNSVFTAVSLSQISLTSLTSDANTAWANLWWTKSGNFTMMREELVPFFQLIVQYLGGCYIPVTMPKQGKSKDSEISTRSQFLSPYWEFSWQPASVMSISI